MHESEFLADNLKRLRKDYKHSYTKITNFNDGRKLTDDINNMMNNKLNVIVYNFVDMLSHARTEMEMIRELADDEAAYRSLTLSWFEHSPLLEAINKDFGDFSKFLLTLNSRYPLVTIPFLRVL